MYVAGLQDMQRHNDTVECEIARRRYGGEDRKGEVDCCRMFVMLVAQRSGGNTKTSLASREWCMQK